MKNLLKLKCIKYREFNLSRLLLLFIAVLLTSCEQDYLKEDVKIEKELG